jgi:hypothetical protein
MDKLKSLKYSVAKYNNRCNILTRYTWKFYDSNNILKTLEYQHLIYYIDTLNKQSRISENIQHVTERYTISLVDKKNIQYSIYNIDEWLINNFEYLKKSNNDYMKSLDIIKYITIELGEYNFALTYEVGWSIKDVYKLYIDLYSAKIVVNYKGKETELSEQKLKTFIQKNKKVIIKAKENDHTKYIQRLNEAREKEHLEDLAKETEKLNIIQSSEHDAIRKVGTYNRCESFIIKRTLKERYETQACKPLPVTYPWHIKH